MLLQTLVPGGWAAAQPIAASDRAPKIAFNSTSYHFGRVMSGEPVEHVFYFTNVGSADLVVTRAFSSCSCLTVTGWTRDVRPGETGSIAASLNTTKVVGASVLKGIEVACNDARQANRLLKLTGSVWNALETSPGVAVLTLKPDSAFGSVVLQITNRLPYPVTLSPPELTNHAFGVELGTNQFGYSYSLAVSNVAALPAGTIQERLKIRTSITNLPPLSILAIASISPVITVVPARLEVAAGTLESNQVIYVSLLNNSSNQMILTDPQIAGVDASIAIKEIKPGVLFSAALTFPPRSTFATGRPLSFSVKTGLPQQPLFKMPIQVGGTTPVAPVLRGESVITAPMPLVYQSEALRSLALGEDQSVGLRELSHQFVQEIGGLNQDPEDPGYLARWERARVKADESLSDLIGRQAMAQLLSAVESPETYDK